MTKEEQIEYFRTKVIKKYVNEVMEKLKEKKQDVQKTD